MVTQRLIATNYQQFQQLGIAREMNVTIVPDSVRRFAANIDARIADSFTAPVTQHVNCRRAFGRLDYNCPRCRELAAGAPVRKGFQPRGAR